MMDTDEQLGNNVSMVVFILCLNKYKLGNICRNREKDEREENFGTIICNPR